MGEIKDMFEEFLKKDWTLYDTIQRYRGLVANEIAKEQTIDGVLMGPRARREASKLEVSDLMVTARPFLSKDVGKDMDAYYVISVRIMRHKLANSLGKAEPAVVHLSGIDLGVDLVKKGVIKDIESFSKVFSLLKIGVVDIFNEGDVDGEKKLDVRVYECISCSGVPNIGHTVCHYEGGIIAGALKEITGQDVKATEIRCWGTGYSACNFDVRITPKKI